MQPRYSVVNVGDRPLGQTPSFDMVCALHKHPYIKGIPVVFLCRCGLVGLDDGCFFIVRQIR